jgi:voltage-gated potassium channel
VVVVLTPPFLGGLFQSIRALRLLRLVRLLRLAPLVRRLFTVEGVRYVALLAALALVGGAQGYAAVEDRSFGDGLYWAVGTMTTVGFGRANTGPGEALGVALAVVGVGFVAILTGAIAQRFLAPAVEELEQTEERVERGEANLAGDVREVIARLERLEAALGGASRAAGSPGGSPGG